MSTIIREMQVQTTTRHHLIPVRMGKERQEGRRGGERERERD
jgi:hypothetical protein